MFQSRSLGFILRRSLTKSIFETIQSDEHDVVELFTKANLNAETLLSRNPEYDPPDLISVKDFLTEAGFPSIPL